MRASYFSMRGIALTAQVAVALGAPLALAFAPPAAGAMLLIPVGGTNAIQFARDHGASLVRPGPIAGSVVVTGMRAELAGDPFEIVALAAAPLGCGSLAVRP